jgi:hypothetical protein
MKHIPTFEEFLNEKRHISALEVNVEGDKNNKNRSYSMSDIHSHGYVPSSDQDILPGDLYWDILTGIIYQSTEKITSQDIKINKLSLKKLNKI